MEEVINNLLIEIVAEDLMEINPLLDLIPLAENNENVLQLFNFNIEDHEPVHNANYFEEVIPRYFPQDFFEHFRMSREVMDMLIGDISNRVHAVGRINIEKKIFFTVWMLAKPESYLACCDRFGLSKGTGHLIFYEICNILCQMMELEIKWPTNEQALATANTFQQRIGFPGIIGAIDGCHIPIKAPAHNGIDYYNRKQFHSMILQGVCDHRRLFIDIFVGMPGRVHDARAFRMSPLYDRIVSENAPLIPENLHILGDSAYPLMKNVMVPFRDTGHLTPIKVNFNTVLSLARCKIEQAFGRLKGKFRRLKYLEMNVENVPTVVTAACVLHNYIIRRDGVQNFDVDIEENGNNVNEGEPVEEFFDDNGTDKRNQIMQEIY